MNPAKWLRLTKVPVTEPMPYFLACAKIFSEPLNVSAMP